MFHADPYLYRGHESSEAVLARVISRDIATDAARGPEFERVVVGRGNVPSEHSEIGIERGAISCLVRPCRIHLSRRKCQLHLFELHHGRGGESSSKIDCGNILSSLQVYACRVIDRLRVSISCARARAC